MQATRQFVWDEALLEVLKASLDAGQKELGVLIGSDVEERTLVCFRVPQADVPSGNSDIVAAGWEMNACLEAGARVVGFYSVGLDDLSVRVANASLPADVDHIACVTIAAGPNRVTTRVGSRAVVGGVTKLDFRPQKPKIQPGTSSLFIRVTTTVTIGAPSSFTPDVIAYWLQLKQSVQALIASMQNGFMTFSEQMYGQTAGVGAIIKKAETVTVAGVQSYGVGVLVDTFGSVAYNDSLEVPLSVYVSREDSCRTVMQRFCDDLQAWQRLVGAVLRTQQSSGSGGNVRIPLRSLTRIPTDDDAVTVPCVTLSLSSYPGVTLYTLTSEWNPDVPCASKPCDSVSAGAGSASAGDGDDGDGNWEITMEDATEESAQATDTKPSPVVESPPAKLQPTTPAVACPEAKTQTPDDASEGKNTLFIALALLIAVLAILYSVIVG